MALTAREIATPLSADGPRRGLTRDEVMTAAQVGELLHLPVSTVYYLARRGEIPPAGWAARGGSSVRASSSCSSPEFD